MRHPLVTDSPILSLSLAFSTDCSTVLILAYVLPSLQGSFQNYGILQKKRNYKTCECVWESIEPFLSVDQGSSCCLLGRDKGETKERIRERLGRF